MVVKVGIRIFLGIFIACSLLFFFQKPIFGALSEWYCQKYCESRLNGYFKYREMAFDNGYFVFHDVKVAHADSQKERFSARQLKIRPIFSWMPLYLDLSVVAEEPHFYLLQNEEDLLSGMSQGKPHPLFKIQGSVILKNGRITYASGLEQAFFDFEGQLQADKSLQILLKMGFSSNDRDAIQFKGASRLKEGEHRYACEFNAVDCAQLATFWKHLSPSTDTLAISQGQMNGEIAFNLMKGKAPSLEGNLKAHHIALALPMLGLKGEVGELNIQLDRHESPAKKFARNPFWKTFFNLIGTIQLSKDSYLASFEGDKLLWEVKDFQGGLIFLPEQGLIVNGDGICTYCDKIVPLHLEGKSTITAEQSVFEMSCFADTSLKSPSKIQFSIQNFHQPSAKAWLDIQNFEVNQIGILNQFFHKVYPVELLAGSIDASLFAQLDSFKISEINLRHFSARDFKFYIKPWRATFECDLMKGALLLNPKEFPVLGQSEAECSISNGELHIVGFEEKDWRLHEINTRFKIEQGTLQKFLAEGKIAGLAGFVEVDWLSPDEMMKLQFHGNAQEVVSLFPDYLKEKINDTFVSDQLVISAGVKRQSHARRQVEGSIHFFEKSKDGADTILFGFAVESEKIPRSLSEVQDKYEEFLRANFPENELQNLVEVHLLTEQKICGLVLRDGWFEAKELNLSKFVSPFVLGASSLELRGTGDFSGIFDSRNLMISYQACELALECESFLIEVKETVREKVSMASYPAIHYFNFEDGSQFGYLPVQQGSYFQKYNELLFEEINASIFFDRSQIHIRHIESFSDGIFFGGAIDIDFSGRQAGIYDVVIHSDIMNGKISQIQTFLSRFMAPSPFLKMPMEGLVSYRQRGGMLNLTFSPETYTVIANVEGALTDGKLLWENDQMRFQDFSLHFDYDHQAKSIIFSDLEGVFLVGAAHQLEEYDVIGDYIRLLDYTQNQAEFDVWISDKSRDILRVVGNSSNRMNLTGDKVIQFTFDHELTHFGDVHPNAFDLTLKEDWQIDDLNFEFGFNISTLVHDFQRLNQTGLFFPLKSSAKLLDQLKKTQGEFQVAIRYDKIAEQYNYQMLGSHLVCDENYHFDSCLLTGRKKGSAWAIDQLQFDQLSLSADILRKDYGWNVNFLGIRFDNALLAGLEGIYYDQNSSFKGKLNLLEVDLGNLPKWKIFQKMIHENLVDGKINAAGEVRIQHLEESKDWRVELLLQTDFKNFSAKGINFDQTEKVFCHFVSDRGMTLRNFKTAFLHAKERNPKVAIDIEKMDFDFKNGEAAIRGCAFSLPANNLEWAVENFQQAFPDFISHTYGEEIKKIKSSGEVQGKLDVDFALPHIAFHLEMQDGTYRFYDSEYVCKNLSFEKDPFESKVIFQSPYNDHLFWVLVRSSAPKHDSGEMLISEHYPEHHFEKKVGVQLLWRDTLSEGFIIDRVEGSLLGSSVHLARVPSASTDRVYEGTTLIQIDQALRYLPKNLLEKAQNCSLNGTCTLSGQWILQKNSLASGENLYFVGQLYGEDLVFRECLFDSLTAEVEYHQNEIAFNNVQVNDPAGKLEIAQMSLKAENEDVILNIPQVNVSDFRPSILRDPSGMITTPATPFVIRHLEIQNVHGSLINSDQITGKGKFTFTNSKKKVLPNTIFAIPGEILSRIGLDVTVLTPVMGSIYYKIKDGKIYFTRFKDLYSNGRLSKFYLPNTSYQSYMDFDGNLHVQVRMKQYNLLFKLAELLTITVQGTVQKPKYSLQKQPQSEHEVRK